jgi:hypothetical protein
MRKVFVRSIAAAGLVGAAAIGLSGAAHAESYGDPDAVAGWWEKQAYNDCAIMAAADVIGQMTGTAPAEDDIVDYAKNTPSVSEPGNMIFKMGDPDTDPTVGTVFTDLPIVLDHYGVSAQYVRTGTLDQLEQALADNQAVVVTLNSAMIWDADGDRTESDHAVVVTGVDTDADNGAGIVHLNDSGPEDGSDEQVSLDTFVAAWQTSDNEMVVTT